RLRPSLYLQAAPQLMRQIQRTHCQQTSAAFCGRLTATVMERRELTSERLNMPAQHCRAAGRQPTSAAAAVRPPSATVCTLSKVRAAIFGNTLLLSTSPTNSFQSLLC
ncbi:hypothetical protein AVDCRST_MAG84-2197, partial [uncultured Microcoleus sp.]